jgi:hypothetical protein
MNRILAFCIASSILISASGCIENPVPDSQLGGQRNRASIDLNFQGWEFLSLRLHRTAAGTNLTVSNPGLGTIDSAAFFMQIGAKWQDGLHPSLMQYPLLEYFGRVGSLKPGDAQDLGIIETEIEENLEDLFFSVYLIRVSVDGIQKGNPLGGVFQGSFSGRDTVYGKYSGSLRGLIDADGVAMFELSEPGTSYTPGRATGRVSPDSSFELNAWFARSTYYTSSMINKETRFAPAGGGVEAGFLFGKAGEWRDSVVLHLDPYNPR